jgi:Esterase/lipase
VCAAVQFVRGEAKAFNIDAERIALMGASAGAHLSGMAALAGESFSKAYPATSTPPSSPKVKALIGVYGVYDMAANWVHFQAQTPIDNPTDIFLGARPCRIASSISRLRRSATPPSPTTVCRCS